MDINNLQNKPAARADLLGADLLGADLSGSVGEAAAL